MISVVPGRRWREWWPTTLAAALSAATVALLIIAFARVSSYERPVVTARLSASVLWISAALIGSCSTIAALTLTTIGLLGLLEIRRMSPRVLMHVRLTVHGSVATIALAVAALVLTTFPVASGVDDAPLAWQIDVVYYGLLMLTALMIGAFAVVLTSLAATVTDVLRTLPQHWIADILHDDDDRHDDSRSRALEPLPDADCPALSNAASAQPTLPRHATLSQNGGHNAPAAEEEVGHAKRCPRRLPERSSRGIRHRPRAPGTTPGRVARQP